MAENKEKSPQDPISFSLEAKIEALLFVSPSSVSPSQMADALDESTSTINAALENLKEELATRGITIQENKGRYQLTTSPFLADEVEKFLQLESTSRFSHAALETLAILAYQQPITRPGIDAIRGVNSDSVLKNLLSKGLIEEIGRSDGPGRPILYGTSPEFLQYFGLSSLRDLPPIEEFLSINQTSENGEDKPKQLSMDNQLLKE
ncbi:SMC-Scp complex subunit ScpB [bacterium]|nr:SMC-Scp complex subunit ScpB [bacterium]